MKLIERYIAREISLPFTVVILILVGLFASFISARLLAGAVTETLGVSALLKLVFLKTLIALEVLIPIALYISVIIGLGRLSKDQELNIIRTMGVSGTRIVLTVLTVAIPVGLISGMLSSYVRPWAYAESYILDAQAEAELNIIRTMGVSGARIVLTVLTVAIPVGLISGMLSSYVRPWAYAESYMLDAQAEAELNTNRFQAGRF